MALKDQELTCHDLHEVASMCIVDHVKFVKNNNTEIIDGTLSDGGIDKGVGLESVQY